jgi:cell division septum initiation protein DivIVA
MDTNQKANSKIYVFFILIILLLLGCIGVLYTKYNKALQTITNIENNLTVVNSEKQKLLTELDSLEQEIKMHMGKNAKLDSLLIEKQAEIEKIRYTLRTQNADIAEINNYKKQIEILRATADQYIKENAYLKYKVDSLKAMNQYQKIKLDTMEIENFQKAKKIDELNEKVEIGSQLRVSDVKVTAYNKKGKPITRAKRVEKIEVAGTMLKNILAQPGKRTIFIRITAPGGVVLTQSSNNQFDYDGKTIMFSEKKEILYNNNDSRFEVYYNAVNDNLEIGIYKIAIFCDGKEVGKSEIELK